MGPFTSAHATVYYHVLEVAMERVPEGYEVMPEDLWTDVEGVGLTKEGDQEMFESAHTALWSIFSNHRDVDDVAGLTRRYTRILLGMSVSVKDFFFLWRIQVR